MFYNYISSIKSVFNDFSAIKSRHYDPYQMKKYADDESDSDSYSSNDDEYQIIEKTEIDNIIHQQDNEDTWGFVDKNLSVKFKSTIPPVKPPRRVFKKQATIPMGSVYC